MSMASMVTHQIKKIFAWVIALVIIALLALGVAFVVGVTV